MVQTHAIKCKVCPLEHVLCTCILVSIKQLKRPLILFSMSVLIETDFCILCVLLHVLVFFGGGGGNEIVDYVLSPIHRSMNIIVPTYQCRLW